MTEAEIIDKQTSEILATVIVEDMHSLWVLLTYSDNLALRFFPMEELEQ